MHNAQKNPKFESRAFRDSKRTPRAKHEAITRRQQRSLKRADPRTFQGPSALLNQNNR